MDIFSFMLGIPVGGLIAVAALALLHRSRD
jgi:hypothetical protein